eukprot:3202839-Prymnesium_polylepis.2
MPASISRDEDFFAAKARVMGYDEPEDGDDASDGDDAIAIAAHLTFERLVRKACVEDPKVLDSTRLLPACVHVECLADAIEGLIEHGLLEAEGDDDGEEIRIFLSYDVLLEACDKIIQQHPDEPRFQVDENWFDAYEPFAAGGKG